MMTKRALHQEVSVGCKHVAIKEMLQAELTYDHDMMAEALTILSKPLSQWS